MKKSLVVLAAMVMVFTMVSGAFAAGALKDNTVTVNAKIAAKCSFNTATSIIEFNTIDPSSTGPITASTSGLTYACTMGSTAPSISYTAAQTLTGSSDTMAYTVSSDYSSATGIGFLASWTPIEITATIAEAVYQVAKAETYTDTFVVTFSY
jgi:hypothetical protein